MHRTKPRVLWYGGGFAALLAIVALVIAMGVMNDSDVRATEEGPNGQKIIATVTGEKAKAGDQSWVVVNVDQAGLKNIQVNDIVEYKGKRWIVTGGTKVTPKPTEGAKATATQVPTPDPAGGEVTLSALPNCDPSDQNPPDPQTNFLLEGKPCNDGNLSGVYDITVPDGGGLYHCIVKQDHDTLTNDVKLSAQCVTDIDGAGDPNSALSGIDVPGEGADMIPGPPPPPPYATTGPAKGNGHYFKENDTLVTYTCFPDLGAGLLGPNVLAKVVIPNAKAQAATGHSVGDLFLYLGVDNETCEKKAPKGAEPAPVQVATNLACDKAGTAGPALVPWRAAAADPCNYDGDLCDDQDELDKTPVGTKCGDDPWNPYDSVALLPDGVEGSYTILTRVARADCDNAAPPPCAANPIPGVYFHCLADIQQDAKDLTVRLYCYTDSVATEVNPEGSPGVVGDGFPGAAPPFPLGDVDAKHTELTGIIDNGDNTVQISGCFEDVDGEGALGHVYVSSTQDAHTGVGTVDIWLAQLEADCTGDTPVGPPTFDDAELWSARQEPGGKQADPSDDRDTDQDGCSNKIELRDDDPTGANGGLRDPYNHWDLYDTNGDSRVDLPNDILGTILRWTPNPSQPYDVNYDRGPTIPGAVGHWNRQAANGTIDLPNDILGVILQWTHEC